MANNTPDILDGINFDDVEDIQLSAMIAMLENSEERERCQGSLYEFVKCAWKVLEPTTPFIDNWHIEVVCAYVQALYEGKLAENRLLINIPPGMMKSLIVSVFAPAWVWTWNAGYKFNCASNGGPLALRDAAKHQMLVKSPWYQKHWGEKVELSKSQDAKAEFWTSKKGYRISQGINANVTGKRGDVVIIDDPHDTKQSESEVTRSYVTDECWPAWATRVNNLNTGYFCIIMQRVHHKDLIAKLESEGGYVKLVIPMEYEGKSAYDAGRDIGRPDLNDPRTEVGEVLSAGLANTESVQKLKKTLGMYKAAGQLQQRPAPKEGGEFKRGWLCRYPKGSAPRDGKCVVIVDPAGERKKGYKKGSRDNSALGLFRQGENGGFYLVDGYRDRLNLQERCDIIFRWHRENKHCSVFYEQYSMQNDITYIKREMDNCQYHFKIHELGGNAAKEDRIRTLLPDFEDGKIWLPDSLNKASVVDGKVTDIIEDFIEQEYLAFPLAAHDDFFDMIARVRDPEVQKRLSRPLRKRPRQGRTRKYTNSRVGY